ncbi:shikimate kinase [Peribacillus sp. SCS-155]|uniref:shikimate kinase n=1 Tax=Peribacillus sedimenti TaxID=3115297 RepID=UPI0039062838
MKSVYLTGFMGAGKTTVGQVLSHIMNIPVYDTDQEIERAEGKSVKEIFDVYGEAAFRNMETLQLKKLPANNAIITTGGGIIVREANRELLNNGYWVYLHCRQDEIIRRLQGDQTRPLISGERILQLPALFEDRLPLYRQAPFIVDTTGKTIDFIAEEIKERIKQAEFVHTP